MLYSIDMRFHDCERLSKLLSTGVNQIDYTNKMHIFSQYLHGESRKVVIKL